MRKSFRIKREAEFQLVFKTGQSVANRQFVVYALPKPGQLHFRVGISVGKKVGNAVTRNQVKRYIRQSLTELKPELKSDVDFLVIARKGTGDIPMASFKNNMIHVLKLAQLINKETVDEDEPKK